MPTVEFSPQCLYYTALTMHCMKGYGMPSDNSAASTVATPTLVTQSSYGVYCRINIYKGTRPTTRPSDASIYNVDKLIQFEAGDKDAGNNDFSTASGSSVTLSGTTVTAQIISVFKAATASGTATWFALVSSNSTFTSVYHWTTGTVGVVGSGADLIISNTNIVSGEQYKIANLTLALSSVFNY